MKRNPLLIILIIVVGIAIFFSYSAYRNYNRQIKDARVSLGYRKQAWLELRNSLEKKVMHFKGTVSIIIEDLDTGWEIAFNKDKLIPSASLVKVPIMLACFYAAQDEKINLSDTVTLKSSQKVPGSKIIGNKPTGSVFSVEELLNPMITRSDNTAANALIDYLGFDALNAYFKKMGLKNTNIARKMMDFEERREGEENYTTAEDMAYLLEELYRGAFLNKDVSERCLALLGQQKVNDRIPRKLPKDDTFVAHKTGLEKYVCHDVGIVYTPKGNFLICILVKHEQKRAKYAKKFISDIALRTFDYYQHLHYDQ